VIPCLAAALLLLAIASLLALMAYGAQRPCITAVSD
jgi:hypothetical protein